MDADDVAHPERLQVQLEELERDPKLDVVSCRVAHFSDNGPVGRGFQLYEEWLNALVCHEDILRERFVESPLPHPTVMARKRVLLAAGGYRDRGWPEDYDLWLRLAERGCRFGKVPRVLLHWRDHGDRLTRNDSRYAVERFLERKAPRCFRLSASARSRCTSASSNFFRSASTVPRLLIAYAVSGWSSP